MPAIIASPDVRNYQIGKSIISFKKDGDTAFRDLGNCPSADFTPDLESLEHFSSREGVKSRDKTVVVSKKGTVKLTLDEWTARNLAMALLGDVDTDSDGLEVIDIFSVTAVSGELKFTGTNDVGPKWDYHFLKVDFIPGSSVNPISDEWGQLEVTGEASAVSGAFGTATKTAEGA